MTGVDSLRVSWLDDHAVADGVAYSGLDFDTIDQLAALMARHRADIDVESLRSAGESHKGKPDRFSQ